MNAVPRLRILLVDDDLADIVHTREALRRRGLVESLRVARGGQEALDLLFGRGQFGARRRFPLPELMLLDLNMPAVDGYTVLRQMRRCEALKRIPVVALCMSEHEGERAMAMPAHPNGYLVKPVTAENFARLEPRVCGWTLRLDLPEPATPPEDESAPPSRHALASHGTGCWAISPSPL